MTNSIDRGTGTPLVLVPGLQGRWEYMRPAVEALAGSFRVLTFPLCGERASRLRFVPSRGLDNYADQILGILDTRRIDRAVICGASFGGLAALRFAATHPDRTASLILVSTPGPLWQLRRRHLIYARAPWLFGPVFLAGTPRRLRKEIGVALPAAGDRWRFTRSQIRTLLHAPLSLTRMAERARLISAIDRVADCRSVAAPTLIVTGEPGLDHVVQVDGTSRYLEFIPNARGAILEGTGHIGSITKPQAFADVVRRFVMEHDHAAA
jgi:pimeloyl-ACP methyl ester carboxylesterase